MCYYEILQFSPMLDFGFMFTEAFGVIKNYLSYLIGDRKDFLVIVSDSRGIIILKLMSDRNVLVDLKQKTFEKMNAVVWFLSNIRKWINTVMQL